MKTLHFDCFAGISGDMTLGALVDLGLDPELLRQELDKLGIPGWQLHFHRDQRGGISGTRGVVALSPQGEQSSHDHHGEHHHEAHRSWKDIRHLIVHSRISDGAKKRALAIFSRIAEAEAQVHSLPVDEVSFHEVGALDSIIDIVGAAIGLDMLKPDRITCGAIELGGGTVTCAHGILPVPAPATLILVQGLPVKTGGFNKEMTTPTGAAILAASVDEAVQSGCFIEIKTGYGIGTRKMDKPNVLRLSWQETGSSQTAAVEPSGDQPWKTEELIVIEANIDDMSGEALGFLMERLFAAGALDVTYSPCMMKKSRPGTLVSVLSSFAGLDSLRRTLFQSSTTIGFRETRVHRLSLERAETQVQGPFGEVKRKTVFFEGKPLRSKIEYEDRARIARDQRISLESVERFIEGREPCEH